MDSTPPDNTFGFHDFNERPSPTRRELQGPRPPPLRVNKDSHKIKKPPVAPQPRPAAPLRAAAPTTTQNPQPVIIYAVSPKVIHTTVGDFMNVVQRLTGADSAAAAGGSGALSPAARLASIEKASPSETAAASEATTSTDVLQIIEKSTAQMSQIRGILSPSPTSLPPVSPSGLFSQASESLMFMNNNMLSPSPSALISLSAPLVSPPSSSLDHFNLFYF
ncbi:unnamed protein product [Cuscuta campestris]|uniref:VQ domain-containing protein n=2 Tax=Cuscuta sect. Cleistogrammica TaxID=1824901 RepID=A0A484L416_9ASTE|nr:hypothetical protein DM860_016023 [Cuscuta australis]VFQ71052.1 unnamed protein product [Cuscuta campestris]